MEDKPEMTISERVALATYLVMMRPQTTASIAQRIGLSVKSTYGLMCRISRVLPIRLDKETNVEAGDRRRAVWRYIYDEQGDGQ